jgi:glycosyl transferase family 2
MKLVCISRVKNEIDIIEAFVRHHVAYFDKLIIVDDASSDGTYEVLRALREEGLPLVVLRQRTVGYEQSRHMTRLMHMAVNQFGADWVVPLDADEFIEPKEGTTLAEWLGTRQPTPVAVRWNNFVWRREFDASSEPNPVVRLRLRLPPRDDLNKVIIPAQLIEDGISLSQGNHHLERNGEPLPAQQVDDIQLCHFPIRSVSQFASKVAIGYLQYSAMPHWDRKAGFQFEEPFRQLTGGVEQLASRMESYSRSYSLSADQVSNGEPVEAALRYAGASLSLTPLRPDRLLGNILDCAEAIALGLADSARRNEDALKKSEKLGQQIVRLRAKIKTLTAERKAEATRAGRASDLTNAKLDQLRRSTSWRLLAPVRWIGRYTKTFGALD